MSIHNISKNTGYFDVAPTSAFLAFADNSNTFITQQTMLNNYSLLTEQPMTNKQTKNIEIGGSSDENGKKANKEYKCKDCAKKFVSRALFKTHCEDIHNNNTPFYCGKCDKSFVNDGSCFYGPGQVVYQYSFTNYNNTHNNITSEAATTESAATDIIHVIDHKDNHNNLTDSKALICKGSGKNSKQSNKKHEKTITRQTMRNVVKQNEKPFECEICGKGYKNLGNYRSHCKIHTDAALVCEFCNKRFGRKSNWKEHRRIHTGEAPYKCRFCVRGFKQQHAWKEHLRIHTGERPYLCTVCGKRFTGGHNLNVHMRVHTGERPYTCEICRKSYRQKSAYNSHVKNVHGIKGHHKIFLV